jgi:hypothetical protein
MTWTDEFFIYNWFEHIWFKNVFDLENYGCWKYVLTKVVHMYVIEGMNA